VTGTEEAHRGHGHAPNRFSVLSALERLGDDARLSGRGVTVAFLDSGFHPHPDLTRPLNRILAYHDVHDPASVLGEAREPRASKVLKTEADVMPNPDEVLCLGCGGPMRQQSDKLDMGWAGDGPHARDDDFAGILADVFGCACGRVAIRPVSIERPRSRTSPSSSVTAAA
jgi:hypothetical protein